MSLENAVLFWQSVQADNDLQAKLMPVRDQTQESRPDAVAKIAQDTGYSVTTGELMQVESVITFWNKAQQDADLQRKLESAQQSETEEKALTAVVQAAQDAGYSFPEEALSVVTDALAAAGIGSQPELSEKELGTVVGGRLSASMSAALQGGLNPARKYGPGIIATYI